MLSAEKYCNDPAKHKCAPTGVSTCNDLLTGGYKCVCKSGYKLEPDKYTCKGTLFCLFFQFFFRKIKMFVKGKLMNSCDALPGNKKHVSQNLSCSFSNKAYYIEIASIKRNP
jgi:hypothetical protein